MNRKKDYGNLSSKQESWLKQQCYRNKNHMKIYRLDGGWINPSNLNNLEESDQNPYFFRATKSTKRARERYYWIDACPIILVSVPRKATDIQKQLSKSTNCNNQLKVLTKSNIWTSLNKYIQTSIQSKSQCN